VPVVKKARVKKDTSKKDTSKKDTPGTGKCQGCRDEGVKLYDCVDKKGPCRLCRFCAFD
jgi:hypothetical protein